MGPWGMTWTMFIIWFLAAPGMIIISQVLTRSKWWKKVTEYYYSWTVDD